MTQIPKGWQKCQNKEIINLWNKICSKAMEKGEINYTPDVWIFKSSKFWGWAKYDVKINKVNQDWYRYYNYNERNKPIVGLNEAFLQKPETALQCMLHELAHIVVYEKNKKLNRAFEKHSSNWKNTYYNLAKDYGFSYSQMTRCNNYEALGIKKKESADYKYEVYCPECGAIWKRKSASKLVLHSERYRCGKCHVSLRVREI